MSNKSDILSHQLLAASSHLMLEIEVHVKGMGELGCIFSRRLFLAEMMCMLYRNKYLLRKSRLIYRCPVPVSW